MVLAFVGEKGREKGEGRGGERKRWGWEEGRREEERKEKQSGGERREGKKSGGEQSCGEEKREERRREEECSLIFCSWKLIF